VKFEMAAKGGRKNLKRAVNDETLSLQPGQSVMRVIDAKGETTLAIFPAKLQKSMWIKQVVLLWLMMAGERRPEIFMSVTVDSSAENSQRKPSTTQENHELDSCEEDDDDDGLPPLEANTNRRI
ncbi:hypothetical protein M8C21_013613, partial [Ambrosia artemisiifolia]